MQVSFKGQLLCRLTLLKYITLNLRYCKTHTIQEVSHLLILVAANLQLLSPISGSLQIVRKQEHMGRQVCQMYIGSLIKSEQKTTFLLRMEQNYTKAVIFALNVFYIQEHLGQRSKDNNEITRRAPMKRQSPHHE